MNTNRPWWYEPLTIGAQQVETSGDPLPVIDLWTGMDYNTEQLLHCIGVGYYACYNPETDREVLERYLARAKANGLRIILYMNTHMLPVAWEEKHPEFFARKRDGGMIPAYNNLYAYADNSSSWRDFAFASARSAVELGVDGIFSDGPVTNDSWSQGRADAFLKEHGRALMDLGDDAADKSLKSQFDVVVMHQFVRDLAAAIKQVNAQCLFYTNLDTHVHPGNTLDVQDLVASEGGFGYYGKPRDVKHWRSGFTAQVLESMAGGKPRVNFISMDLKPWFRVLKPGSDVLRQAANTVQHGANYWIGWSSPESDLTRPEPQHLVPLNRAVTAHPDVYGPTRSLARVALYWSFASLALDPDGETTDFYARGNGAGEVVIGHHTEMGGWNRALIASHIPFAVLASGFTTREALRQFDTVVLPAVSVLTCDEVTLLTEWVEGGGRLVVSADLGRLKADGTIAGQAALANLIGLVEVQGIQERGNYNFITIIESAPAWLWAQPGELLPSWTRALIVQADAGYSAARFHEPTVGQYVPLQPLAGDAIHYRQVGQGEVIFFAGNIGDTYGNFGLPAFRQLMANAVSHRTTNVAQIENGPGFLEISVRESLDEPVVAVHLVNHGGDFEQPTETPVILHNVHVTLNGKFDVKTARALMSGTDLPIERAGDSLSVRVPPFGVYEVIRFGL